MIPRRTPARQWGYVDISTNSVRKPLDLDSVFQEPAPRRPNISLPVCPNLKKLDQMFRSNVCYNSTRTYVHIATNAGSQSTTDQHHCHPGCRGERKRRAWAHVRPARLLFRLERIAPVTAPRLSSRSRRARLASRVEPAQLVLAHLSE